MDGDKFFQTFAHLKDMFLKYHQYTTKCTNLNIIITFSICLCGAGHVCLQEVTGKLLELYLFSSSCGFWGWNNSHQAWQQIFVLIKPFQ